MGNIALAATGLGLLNGWGATKIGLPSFMATLATQQIASGLGLFITKGEIIYTLVPTLNYLGGEYIGTQDPWRLPVVIICGATALLRPAHQPTANSAASVAAQTR